MPYQSGAQRRFMHVAHPDIAKRWDAEISNKTKGSKGSKVYKTGTPVAHKNMTLNPTGYINREINKGSKVQRSTQRSGLAKMGLERAAQRRMELRKNQPKPRG